MQNSEKPPNEPAGAQMERDSYDLPSHDALSKILPVYLHLLKKPKTQTRTESVSQKKSQLNRTFDVHSPLKSPPIPDFEDDPHAGEVTEHQTKELENYRMVMHKMADDIVALRSQVSTLESENSQLRRDLSLNQDLTLLDDTDTDVMTKTKIADWIASLKFKLSSESSKAAAQKDRIQHLQNELIRKSDIEKEFVQLQRAHQQQQAVLKKYQARSGKISALEDTVRQQEKTLLTYVVPFSDSEKLELLTQLARAGGRIRTLEQQLKENSRQWGKEKQEMLTRLSEYEHRFARTSTMILHDLPVKSLTDSVLGHTLHRQLEPLK
ncbi:coiled-coil domain-containing protein 33-like [Sinocyclocheilus anshuiensis]|uniref:coiled-coil domain-containing protein 33-like n=1 Tax=Sinocyclocheilus anshuiensis TaxID=1608454 RepID=UPI0007B8D44B|nr:PREDICTED: coiled-coil domain-containing protein 33-like [Sinocyclocheilus anshuiensis]